MSPLDLELEKRIAELGANEKRKLLEYVRALGTQRPPGTPGAELLRFAGSIPKEDLEQMREAICESRGIDVNEW